jgi:DNA modification methylase
LEIVLLVVECPKKSADSELLDKGTYSYYAGYSLSFAERLIRNIPFEADSIILDPWNGSGTTTLAASRNGVRSTGSDLNPVMVVVAKARLLQESVLLSVRPIWVKIRSEAESINSKIDFNEADPLSDWFTNKSVVAIRRVENSIRSHLIGSGNESMIDSSKIEKMSNLAAFFYVRLFQVTRQIMLPFRSSNPTWLRRPKKEAEKLSTSLSQLVNLIEKEVSRELVARNRHLTSKTLTTITPTLSSLNVCSSEQLTQEDNSVDLVLTSPPYCTRIDYAVATSAELAILGFDRQTNFAELRSRLMGTTTVPRIAPKILPIFGKTCLDLLNDIKIHPSAASSTYYLKNHLHYFSSLQKSLEEITRVLKPQGIATFVVQDSAYKEIHNDLPTIVSEMACALNLVEFQRDDFSLGASISSINSRSRRYKPAGFKPTESVLSFFKP